jgi:hypothetical protein
MGKHEARSSLLRGPILVVAMIAVVASVAAIALYVRAGDEPPRVASGLSTCGRTLRVVTAFSFAPVLDAVASQLRSDDDCLDLDVQVTDGRAAPDMVERTDADVWIPDDSSWVAVANRNLLAAEQQAGAGTVLAETPIYMVTDAPTADRLRSAGGSWLALARLLDANSGIRLAVRDPAGSGDGMIGAGGVAEAVWLAEDMDASALWLARALGVTRTVTGRAPALPRRPGEVGLVPEYALLPLLTGTTKWSVLSGSDYALMLRYTWLPTASAVRNPSRTKLLNRLRDALASTDIRAALNEARLRPPDADTAQPPGTDVKLPKLARKPMGVLGAHHVDHVLATWYRQDRRTDLLAVIDISGSMGQRAPGSGARLIDLVKEGCRGLVRMLPDDSRVGLWEFGADLDPPRDYRSLVRTAPLSTDHRAAMNTATGRLATRHTGTGLYDTILAAYGAARDSFKPGVPNQVLVFTDGLNEANPHGITLAQLRAGLDRAKDPARPVHLSVVAFGQKQQAQLLSRALEPVDGYVDEIATAEEVAAVFIHVAAGGLHGD